MAEWMKGRIIERQKTERPNNWEAEFEMAEWAKAEFEMAEWVKGRFSKNPNEWKAEWLEDRMTYWTNYRKAEYRNAESYKTIIRYKGQFFHFYWVYILLIINDTVFASGRLF